MFIAIPSHPLRLCSEERHGDPYQHRTSAAGVIGERRAINTRFLRSQETLGLFPTHMRYRSMFRSPIYFNHALICACISAFELSVLHPNPLALTTASVQMRDGDENDREQCTDPDAHTNGDVPRS